MIYRSTDLTIYGSTDLAIHRFSDLHIHQSSDVLIYGCSDLQIHRSSDVHIHWASDLQIHRTSDLQNQWSVLAILLFTKTRITKMKNVLKSRSLFVFYTRNKKRTPFFNFDSPLWKPEKSAPFSHKKRDIFRICLRYKVNQLSWVIFISH